MMDQKNEKEYLTSIFIEIWLLSDGTHVYLEFPEYQRYTSLLDLFAPTTCTARNIQVS